MTEGADDEIRRLRRRLERERESRRQAELIADRGMRELWLANRELDERVSERTADLAKALADFERVVSVRQRFLATLSHEMRTPMNGLLGMLELLETCLADPNDLTYLSTASQSAARLNLLLARLLDLLDLQSGVAGSGSETVDLSALASGIEDRWQRAALRSGQLLSVGRPLDHAPVLLDVARVNQIVDELIDNAVTHADPGPLRVELSVSGGEFELSVTDAGPGIAPERIASIAEEFEMLDDSSTRRAQGLGLGLSLCMQTAALLEGSLDIESDGSTFTKVTLKLAAPTSDVTEVGDRETNGTTSQTNGQASAVASR